MSKYFTYFSSVPSPKKMGDAQYKEVNIPEI